MNTFPLPGKIAPAGGNWSFVSSGLLVWQDDKNFIRMERAAADDGPAPFVWVERFKDGESVSQELAPIADRATYLKVERQVNRFTFSAREDAVDQKWTIIHTEESAFPKALQVGVVAINTATAGFSATLEELTLANLSLK